MTTKTTTIPTHAVAPGDPVAAGSTPLARLAARRAALEARAVALRGALAQLDADACAAPDAPPAPTRATRLAELAALDQERILCDATEAELQARATIQAARARVEVLNDLEALLAEYDRTATARRQRLKDTGATMGDLEAAVAADRLGLSCAHDLHEATGEPRFLRRVDLHARYWADGGDRAASLQRNVRRPPIAKPPEWEALLARFRALTPEAGR